MNCTGSKFLFFIGFLFCVGNLVGQTCPDQNIYFSTQTQLDSFYYQYPNCIEFDHEISIYTPANASNLIHNLNALSRIKVIHLAIC